MRVTHLLLVVVFSLTLFERAVLKVFFTTTDYADIRTDKSWIKLSSEQRIGQSSQIGLEQARGDMHVSPARIALRRRLASVQRSRQGSHTRCVAWHAVYAYSTKAVYLEGILILY